MSTGTHSLDRAIEIAEREAACIKNEDVEGAAELARERAALLQQELAEHCVVSSSMVAEKLLKLKAKQGQLTKEARTLHGKLQEELNRIRGERRRLAGYGCRTRVLPLASRFVSKKG